MPRKPGTKPGGRCPSGGNHEYQKQPGTRRGVIVWHCWKCGDTITDYLSN